MLRQFQCIFNRYPQQLTLLALNCGRKNLNYCEKFSTFNEKGQHNENNQEQGSTNQNDNNKQKSKRAPKKTFVPAIKDPFAGVSQKTKGVYLSMVNIFTERDVHRRNHVEFIYAAMKHMAEFGVERDLEVYKALINVMPKGKMIPVNLFQAEFMHYPKQQQCVIDLLEQMEDLGVMPDYEMEAMLLNIFGRQGHPLRKYWRMMYWMPKFKNLSPWPLPNPIPDDTFLTAKLAVERMCSIDVRSNISIFETKDVKDALDQTWIVSGMSSDQSKLLNEHPRNVAVYIEGPFLIWLRNRTINYFTLRADPDIGFLKSLKYDDDEDDVTRLKIPLFGRPAVKKQYQVGKVRSVHQQDDGTIFAICATGTSTKDSLLSWIRLLEINGNPSLGEIPVLFRIHSKVEDKSIQIEGQTNETVSPSTIDESKTSHNPNENR